MTSLPSRAQLGEDAERVNPPLSGTSTAARMRKSALLKCEAALWFIVVLLAVGLLRIW